MALPTSDNTVNVTRLGSILSTLWAKIKTALSGKQDKLTSQTAYSAKGTATKVPQITTNSLGQVTGITEVTISGVTPASHASTATTYGIGTASTYGHVKLATGDMNGATNTDGVAVSKNHTHSQYAPKASPALTGTPTAPTAADGTNTTQIATTAFVQSAVAQGLSVSDAMVYKGTVTLGATSPGGLTVAADKGHTYKVVTNGNTKEGYVDGVKVEAGDMVICNTDSTAAATSSNYSTIAAKWDFVQGNTDGVVVGPASATSGNVVVFDGATGKLVKDGGTLGTAAFKNVDTTPTDNSTNAVTSGGVKTALDGKVSSIKKNGSTITPSSGVADIGYMPVTEAQGITAAITVQEAIQALRVKPGGRMGSVLLSASTVSSTSIPAAWYNYIWIPHRTGAPDGDNQNFGTLILTPLSSTPDVYVIEGSSLNTSSPVYRIKRLDAVTAEAAIATGDKLLFSDDSDGSKTKRMSTGFDTDATTTMLRRDGTFAQVLYADEGWGGSFRTSLSPFDNYAFKSANCFFGAKPSAIAVEYSNDGGTTWTDYGCTDEQKVKLFSQYDGYNVYCGHNMHIHPGYTGTITGTKDLSNENIANQRLRITICESSLANVGTTSTTDRWIYCNIRRFGIYMSTQSASGGAHCLVEYRNRANFRSNTDTWVSIGDFKIQGDSGWNSIPANNAKTENKITFGNNDDSHAKEFRFTIWSDQLSATPAASSTGNMLINRIVAYSELLWTNSSSRTAIGYYGSPCTVDPVSGTLNLGKAKFTARELSVDLSSTSTTATSFDGTANVSIKNTGTLPVSKGGTGKTSVTAAEYNILSKARTELTAPPEDNYRFLFGTTGPSESTGIIAGYITASNIWSWIKGNMTSVSGVNISGNAATATTATNFNTSSGNIKTELEGKSSTTHTHSVSINGNTKTIAASGGTAVDLGTYKVFNYARVYTTQTYNANTNRYIMLAFNAATYTSNWEESSMFKLVAHDGQLPKELVFRLWLKGSVSTDPSNPKLYRVYSENFSESALNILDVRLFVVERSAESIQFTIGIFIDRNYLQGQYISYQLYPLSYGTRDRGNTIDNGLSNWTYTVGQDIYRSNDQHSVFTTAFEVNDLSVDMSATKAVKLSTARKLAVSLSNTSTDTSFDGSADVTNIKTTGILPVSNGGTGKNYVTAGNYLVGNGTNALVEKAPNVAANDLINALSVGNTTPSGDDYYVSQYANGGTTTTTFHRRPISALWEYIKSQISSVLGLTATNYGGNAATATTVTSANITRTPDTTNGDKLQIGSGTAANVVNSKSTLNVAASAASTNTSARHIWFSDSSTETKRAYNDDLTYRTDYNRITTNISGYATGLTNQRGIQHQQAATSYPVHRIASYPSPNITTQGGNADNSLVLHLFTKGHNASDYGIALITVKLASPVSNNPTVNVRWKLRSSGMPTDAVQAAFIKDGSGLWHVDVFFIVQHQYQLTVFNKLGSFSALDGSPNGGWVLYSSNVDSSYADGKECYTDISGDGADTASKRLYNADGYVGAATGITDDGIVGTASKLSSYGGGKKQPVYFPSTGVNAGKPVAMDTVSHDNETYLDMNVERAYSAVAANSANTAGGLSLSSAVGSGTRPVYFNAQGAPLPIDYTNEEYLGNPVLNLTVTKARNALYVNGYSLAVGSYGGVSNRIYFC